MCYLDHFLSGRRGPIHYQVSDRNRSAINCMYDVGYTEYALSRT